MKNNVVVIGSGGHAKVVIDIIECMNQYTIYGIIDPFRTPGEMVNGYRVLGNETILAEIENELIGGIVAIGDNWIRSQVVSKIKMVSPCFQYIKAIHPASVIAKSSTIGAGTVVMAGAVINSNCRIGDHCIINTRSSVGHDNLIGNFATIAPGVTIGGNVIIGDFSAVLLGANIIHSKRIGNHTIIGAGSTVLSDIKSYKVAYGVPAKIIRVRKEGEKYL